MAGRITVNAAKSSAWNAAGMVSSTRDLLVIRSADIERLSTYYKGRESCVE